MYPKMFHEGQFVVGKAWWRTSWSLWSRQDICTIKFLLLLSRYERRCQNICGEM